MTRKTFSVITTVWGAFTILEGGAALLALIRGFLELSSYLASPILGIFIAFVQAICILAMIPSALLLKCGIITFKCGISGINGADPHEVKKWSIVSIIINALLFFGIISIDSPLSGILALLFVISPLISIALSVIMLIISQND